MSSPAIEAASTSSARPASRRRSKAGTRRCVWGSRRANSSSIPTVPSVESSKRSRAAATSITGALGQVEVQRVEEVDGGARGVDRHLRWHLKQRLGVVEDDLHAGVDELVGEGLGRTGRHGEDADDDVLLLDDLAQLVGVADPRGPDLLADLGLVGVEDRHDAEAMVGEDVRGRDRAAEVARAEQRDVVLAARAQDLADLRDERVDVVAHPALAELAEAGEVAADLGRVDVGVLGELLGGDRLLAHLARLGEDLQVARETGGHTERQAIGERAEAAVALLRDVAEAHRASR